MKRLFAYITVVLLLSAGAVFAWEGGGYGAPPLGPESGSDPQARAARPDPISQNEGGSTAGGEYGQKKPDPEGAESLYRQERPSSSVGSRWQVEVGGSIEMEVGHRQ
ncbi:MAG: hypothetical protein ABSD38_17800 [Syntrophorhabdales bacterium]|jgi:hypothetical protein